VSKKKTLQKLMIFILLVLFFFYFIILWINIFYFFFFSFLFYYILYIYLSLCISPINNDKINLIDSHASVWSIELDTIESSIEHPIYHSALFWSIKLYGFCIIYAYVLVRLIIVRSIWLIVIQSNDQLKLTRFKVWSNIQSILIH